MAFLPIYVGFDCLVSYFSLPNCFCPFHSLTHIQALGCLAGMIAFLGVASRWTLQQEQCYNGLPVAATCNITDTVLISLNADRARFYYLATSDRVPSNQIVLFPDCRYRIRSDYSGLMNEAGVVIYRFPPHSNKVGTLVDCYLDDGNPSPGANVTGVYIKRVYESSSAGSGWKITLGVASGFVGLSLIGVAIVMGCCRSECREDCYAYDESVENWGEICKHGGCLSPFVFHCSLNPYECFRFCLPCLTIWKILVNIIVFVIILIALAVYVLGNTDSTFY